MDSEIWGLCYVAELAASRFEMDAGSDIAIR